MVSDGGPPSKMVQLYRPRDLTETSLVSVSGIDISKNKKELLVSYENDQIYSFPICPNAANASGPTVDELSKLSNQMEEQETVQHELCAYGGHLNRYTFLKVSDNAGGLVVLMTSVGLTFRCRTPSMRAQTTSTFVLVLILAMLGCTTSSLDL